MPVLDENLNLDWKTMIAKGKVINLMQIYKINDNDGLVAFNNVNSGMLLGLRPANERRRYKVTPSLIG